ncbi:MFS transporter [Streptomyces sp. LaPpAH-108]|uniref:MFS transporter n=1 Tax=Streptomyces sp. LaPpAH-108 TaxID=1155714 RepID=UPI00037DAA12|nr:MFS transporter [Streptomyces sp. LaPpAH-108]
MSAPAPARPAAPSYAAVLRVPHARRTFAAALTGRFSNGVIPLAVLLSVNRATGSYAVSGAVMSLFGGVAVLLMPVRASLVDRYGARRALPPMAALYAVLLCVLAVLVWRPGVPAPLIGTAAALAGACVPPLGPVMRAVWSALVADRQLQRRAYSLDGVAEELLFVSGPVLVGALITWAPPASGILLGALLVVGGTAAFVTSPAMAGPRTGSRPGPRATARRSRSGGVPGLLVPVAVAAGAGLALSGVELLVTAYAERGSYDAALVPWVLGALSAGSALGGLVNGAIDWRLSARARLAGFTAALGLVITVAGLAPGLWTLTAAMVCTGVFIAPTLTTAYLLADETAPEDARTRAGAWVNMAVNAGSSSGSLLTGALIGRFPLPLCFALPGTASLAAAAITLMARRGGASVAGASGGPAAGAGVGASGAPVTGTEGSGVAADEVGASGAPAAGTGTAEVPADRAGTADASAVRQAGVGR